MTELTNQNFEETIASSQPTVIDFWASWCMPCKIFAPVFEQVSDTMTGKANFYKVNIDEQQELAQKYGVASIPTIIIFKDGAQVDQMVGVQPKEAVLSAVEKHV